MKGCLFVLGSITLIVVFLAGMWLGNARTTGMEIGPGAVIPFVVLLACGAAALIAGIKVGRKS